MALYTQKYWLNHDGSLIDPHPWRRRFIILLILIAIAWALTHFQLWTYVIVGAICGLGLLFGGYGGHPER